MQGPLHMPTPNQLPIQQPMQPPAQSSVQPPMQKQQSSPQMPGKDVKSLPPHKTEIGNQDLTDTASKQGDIDSKTEETDVQTNDLEDEYAQSSEQTLKNMDQIDDNNAE
jgi:hypothetical protein